MPHGSISGDSLGLSARPVGFGALSARQSSRWQAAFGHAVKAVASFLGGDSGEAPGGRIGAASSAAIEALEGRQLLSATYFVSNGGSDSNPGTVGKPFHSIQHAASIAGPGDTVDIFGGVYHETVTPAHSGTAGAPITFQAYKGQKVEIDGADAVSGFTKYSGSIYKANAGGSLGDGNNQVFVNGQMVNEARWPNSTSLSHPTLAHVQKGTLGSLTDSALSSSGGNWVGATLHIAAGQQWVAQTATVTAQSGNTLYFQLGHNVDPHFTVKGGNPFYLTGKFQGLKSAGQWFIDSGGNLYLWAPNGGSPTGVEVKHRQYGFNLSNKSNIVINGVDLFACTINGNKANGIHINGIHATYLSQFTIARDGWHPGNNSGIFFNGNNNSVSNSVIAYSAGDGILMFGTGNSATNNVIHDVAYQGFDNAGIRIWGSGDTISNNTIYNAGRDGIKWSGTKSTKILHNLVHDVMLQATDGGAIYTYGTNGSGSEVAYNLVYNVKSGGWGAAGLYFDNGSSNFYIHNNDVFNVDIGLKMNPTNFNERVINNTLLASMQSVASYGSRNMSGSVFQNNVFNNTLMIGGSVKMINNVRAGDTSGVKFAGASMSA